jgi:hypothetical protein
MLFSRNVPRGLYVALPAIYLAVGITVVALVRSPLGRASGLLLIAAAGAVLNSRRQGALARRDAQASRQSSILAPPSRLASTTEFVRTLVPPKVGHRDIDRQHRSLASRTATLRVAYAHNDDPLDLEQLAHELVDAVAQHLHVEVEAMARLGAARPAADVEADRRELAAAQSDLGAYQSGGMTLEALIDRIAGPLVAGHLRRPHPPLLPMEAALQQLRDGSGAAN